MARMSADAPAFDVLGFVSADFNSPLLKLVEAVDSETRMIRLYDELAAMSPEDAARLMAAGQGGGSLSGNLGDAAFQRLYARSGVFQRVALDFVANSTGGKNEARAGAAGALREDVDRRRAELITGDFALWHLPLQGEIGQRPVDQIIAALDSIRENRVTSSFASTPADDTILNQSLAALTRNNGSRPGPLAQMLNAVEGEFRAAANDATMVELNQKLVETVTLFCRDNIKPFFPFSQSNTHLSPSIFGQFFAPGGLMDQYYSENLQPHVLRTADGLAPDPASPLGPRINRSTLRQFDRAQRIQQAFFASGSAEPKVQMSIQHLSSSPSVNLATLVIHGERIITQPNSTPAKFTWPGGTSGVAIELTTSNFLEAPPRMEFSRGRWDIVTFLQDGRPRGKNVLDVTKSVQGASITYRFEFDSPTIPFLMTELREFNCPDSLE
jgi:type VI secretion system protein ImpL